MLVLWRFSPTEEQSTLLLTFRLFFFFFFFFFFYMFIYFLFFSFLFFQLFFSFAVFLLFFLHVGFFFFYVSWFFNKFFGEYHKSAKQIGSILSQILSSPIRIQAVCKGYQQMILAGKELTIFAFFASQTTRSNCVVMIFHVNGLVSNVLHKISALLAPKENVTKCVVCCSYH